jgi:hypothetical protein
MKLLKGCLISLIISILLILIGFYFLKNNILTNLEASNKEVNQKWNSYISILKERNSHLLKQNLKNDSLKYYFEKSKSINFKENSKRFEYNEYKINKFIKPDSLILSLNDSLNSNINTYNKVARKYNFYKLKFPNSFIIRKTNLNKRFKYFEIKYGSDNEEIMSKKKKRGEWIKNGGTYPM